ncbi:MAG: zinc-ribbon domain-containing protein [Labilithrix sp.]|nr:zinc-ribbon domain-containing protein [Labilithrix sp.]
MKFLCDNCKAKYQIADEKVAGKTVRMKCRKCGHQIEVRAAVTETSVASGPPKAPSEAPRAGAAKTPLATSLSATKPRAPMTSTQPSPSSGALAGAFQRTVQDAPQTTPYPAGQASALDVSVTDEWYVAINGVPVGPVRISELRRKAAAGAVTEDSLCWQEGLEEWRPVRSIPDLAAIVREAAQGNRPSLVSPPPPDRGSAPPRAPQRSSPSAAPTPPARGSEPPIQAPRPLQPSRSNVVPLRVAASSNVDRAEDAPATAPLGGAAAALAPTFTPAPQPIAPPAPIAISDPFAVPPAPAPSAPAPSAPALAPSGSASLVPPVYLEPPRRGVPLWFWPILLLSLGFGGMAAFFLFKQQPPPPAPVVINMPPTNTATPAPTTGDAPPPAPSATETETAPTSSAPSHAKVATGPKSTGATPAATAPKAGGVDVTGLLGGTGGGPAVGPGNTPGGSAGGGLDQAGVERVVAARRMGVRRTCWDSGNNDKKSSVNVTVTATVGPDGSVTSTSSSGDDPQVGKCIESQVRTWKFPAPGSTTTINIPFKFVRQ